ncbi:MAG: hypothetical protein JWP63_1440 [Candidatus Solibacter sp.]|nr:hypothetical protein [Candidatus Solibacter sp.]
MKYTYGGAFALIVLLAGCGKDEHNEAVRLSKALTEQQANFASANALEKSFVKSAQDWADGIASNGSGKGDALDQNAAVAAQLSKNAVAIGAELSPVRQAVDDQSLQSEFTKGVRSTLVTQLTKRQRYLQDMRALLDQVGPEFLTYKADKSYKGDLCPSGVNKLAAMLSSHAIPNDDLGTALAALKTQYKFEAGEI